MDASDAIERLGRLDRACRDLSWVSLYLADWLTVWTPLEGAGDAMDDFDGWTRPDMEAAARSVLVEAGIGPKPLDQLTKLREASGLDASESPGPGPEVAACMGAIFDAVDAHLEWIADPVRPLLERAGLDGPVALPRPPFDRWLTDDARSRWEGHELREWSRLRETVHMAQHMAGGAHRDEDEKLYLEALAALGPLPRRLLEFMWDRERAGDGEVIDYVCGHDSDRTGENLKVLISQMQRQLIEKKIALGWSLHRSGGMVTKERS